jgi:hypothetical protein
MNVPVEMPEAVEYEGVFGKTDYLEIRRMAARSSPAAGSMEYSAPAAAPMQYFASDEEDVEIEDLEIEDVEIEGDISFSLADMVCEDLEELEPSKARPRGTSPVEVVSAAGLDEVAIDSLNEHLATLTVPRGTNGELVLEIVFGKVRASRIVVDAEASTLADVELLKTIKKWLLSWRIPHSIGDTVRLTLRVRS